MKKALIIIGIVIVAGAAAGFLFWQDYKSGALTGDQNLAGTEQSDGGQKHIPVGSEHEPYLSNPPTSGPHYEQPAAWGVYSRALEDEQLVHNLEHGGIWISHRDVDPDTLAKIEDIGRQNPGSVIVTPRQENPTKIVLASWRRSLELEVFDRDVVMDFIKRNKNKSPEPLAN